MKTIVNKLMLLAAGLMITLSCTTDIDRVTYLGAGAPGVVLKVSSTSDLVLLKANQNYNSLQFQWTNPNYQFSNGPSTQDVNYTLQIDTTGSNFTNPNMGKIAFTNDVSHTFTVAELNTTLNKLQLSFNYKHPFEFRVVATLANNNEPVYSNVVKVKITTYLDVVYPVPANLYITGSATPGGWGPSGAPLDAAHVPVQQFTKINAYTFQLTVALTGGQEFLFVPDYTNWAHKYAFPVADGNNTSGDIFVPDAPGNFKGPAASGNYTITVNFATGKFTIQ